MNPFISEHWNLPHYTTNPHAHSTSNPLDSSFNLDGYGSTEPDLTHHHSYFHGQQAFPPFQPYDPYQFGEQLPPMPESLSIPYFQHNIDWNPNLGAGPSNSVPMNERTSFMEYPSSSGSLEPTLSEPQSQGQRSEVPIKKPRRVRPKQDIKKDLYWDKLEPQEQKILSRRLRAMYPEKVSGVKRDALRQYAKRTLTEEMKRAIMNGTREEVQRFMPPWYPAPFMTIDEVISYQQNSVPDEVVDENTLDDVESIWTTMKPPKREAMLVALYQGNHVRKLRLPTLKARARFRMTAKMRYMIDSGDPEKMQEAADRLEGPLETQKTSELLMNMPFTEGQKAIAVNRVALSMDVLYEYALRLLDGRIPGSVRGVTQDEVQTILKATDLKTVRDIVHLLCPSSGRNVSK
jgi:hypothetical protein